MAYFRARREKAHVRSENALHHAAQEVQKLKSRPSNEKLLQLYALYKQATEGDVRAVGRDFSISPAAPSTTRGPPGKA